MQLKITNKQLERPAVGAPGNPTPVVWLTATDAVNRSELLNAYRNLLDDVERQRHASFVFPADQHLYLVAHALLRTSLSHHFGVSPQDWRFSGTDGQRPEVVQQAGEEHQARFSLSHTPGLAACIIAECLDVGVDVERLNRPVDAITISGRYFAPYETQQLVRLSGHARQARFLEYWTLKEAYVKACGLGLSLPLNSFYFYQDDRGAWQIEFRSRGKSSADTWQFLCVRPTRDHVMSIAIRNLKRRIDDISIRQAIPLGEMSPTLGGYNDVR